MVLLAVVRFCFLNFDIPDFHFWWHNVHNCKFSIVDNMMYITAYFALLYLFNLALFFRKSMVSRHLIDFYCSFTFICCSPISCTFSPVLCSDIKLFHPSLHARRMSSIVLWSHGKIPSWIIQFDITQHKSPVTPVCLIIQTVCESFTISYCSPLPDLVPISILMYSWHLASVIIARGKTAFGLNLPMNFCLDCCGLAEIAI